MSREALLEVLRDGVVTADGGDVYVTLGDCTLTWFGYMPYLDKKREVPRARILVGGKTVVIPLPEWMEDAEVLALLMKHERTSGALT